MIQDKMIQKLLHKEIPGLKDNEQAHGNIAGCINAFTQHTAELIEQGELEDIGRCFQIANQLLSRGSDKIRSMVIVEFMAFIFPLFKKEESRMARVKALLKDNLLEQYQHSQLMDPGEWF